MSKPRKNTPPTPALPTPPDPSPKPNLLIGAFAAAFTVAMFINLHKEGDAMLTIFLGSAVMFLLGFDLSKFRGSQ